ncbi:TKL protein kinase [Saprolegnia parasitica CBS 223.65]|uniref:TKL protein kinase n=1 Tax=Saprolegnia parasitica (strain CBS 223.65) TaxID=695850 RepID=A0A067C815_SAPPC|nr:TKL protein kinase [Saprolegnia parasitica CBS 223.65]KDO25295.1 TKL protein kinase [Saprolegnia parasitica CBS 223.65]|eukprot:XP_012203953.1 TKL protein kinase [Saprolegnia parasitica CBS 223.65]
MRIVDTALLAIAGLVAGQSDDATLPVCDASVNVTHATKFMPHFYQCSNVTGGVDNMLASPLYCKTPACTTSMDIAHSVLSTCTPVAGLYFTPGRLCSPECVNKTTQIRQIRQQCLSTSAAALGLCFQCKNYVIEMKAYRAICEVLDSVEALRNDPLIKAAAAVCFTPAPTTLPPSTSDSNSTTYVVIGCVVGVVLVAAVLFACLRKKTPKGDVYTSAGNTTNGSGNLHSMRLRSGETTNQTGNTRVANDIRFDAELSQFRIPQQEIQNISLLVKGGYGVVFHATFGKQDVAMKQLLPSKAKDAAAIQDFMNEIRLCARLEHPKIVKFVGISWSTLQDLAVLSEFMSNGDVTGLIRKERKRPEGSRLLHWFPQGSFPATKTSISADTADALVYLHSFQPTVIHRDLKSKNVLLSETWEAKLSDFGISRVTSLEESMTSNIGTIAWIAPEVLTGGRYTEKADIYSFGVLMAELDTLQVPYADLLGKASENGFSNARLAMMVSEGELQPSFTESMPSELLALARECLSFHDNDRPSAIQLSYKLHKILNENNYQ